MNIEKMRELINKYDNLANTKKEIEEALNLLQSQRSAEPVIRIYSGEKCYGFSCFDRESLMDALTERAHNISIQIEAVKAKCS